MLRNSNRANSRRERTNKKKGRRSKGIKLREWSDESMLGAIQAVREGTFGVNRAALEYGVPKTTLNDRISGRVVHGASMGAQPYLSREEEGELVDFLKSCCKMGYGKNRKEVFVLVEAILKKKGRDLGSPISNGWWQRFLERWPSLSLRTGDAFSVARDRMTDHEVFDSYFKLLKQTLEENGILHNPGQIYNCDVSGMPLEHKLPCIISQKGAKKIRQRTSGNKTQISILACANAIGQALPPMVIFTGKRFNHELSVGEVPGTLYVTSESGWMDNELFFEWFSKHFLKHASPCRPLLLLLDGHSSHYTLDLIKEARQHGVIIFCLPPHTTADSQPLDTSVFGPLKIHWSNEYRQYIFDHPGRVITKFQFSTLFSRAWTKGMSMDNIVAGFRSTGVYPFNPNALLHKIENTTVQETAKSSNVSTVLSDNTGIDTCSTDPEVSAPPSNSAVHSLPVSTSNVEFTAEETATFERRFDEHYDIFSDSKYVSWLHQHHPDEAPSKEHMNFSYQNTSGNF